MAYNKAREEKKWRLWKEAEEKQLRSLGVNEDDIEKLRVHDWAIFNSDRRYYQRVQETGTYLDELVEDTTQPEVKTVEDFLDSIENQHLYDDLMKSYRAYLGEINDQLATIENLLYQNELAIENAQGENLSTEVYKRLIDATIENIDNVSDADKKILMNALLEKVEIFKEKQADGRWVKSVQFKIPLNIDGKLVDIMFFDDDEDTENSLPNEKRV